MNDSTIKVGDWVKLKSSINPDKADATQVEQIEGGKAGYRVSTGFGGSILSSIAE